jgi:Tfp pilus assembly protein PilE
MVVVVILGVLAGIARVGYHRYVGRARATEAVAMLAEMTAKEQVYFLEFAQYLPLVTGAAVTAAAAAAGTTTENANQFFPRDPSLATFDSVSTAASVTALPLSWQLVAVRPKDTNLYCTYFASAGLAGSNPAAGTMGAGLLGAVAIVPPWFYVVGSCNLHKDAAPSFPTKVTSFVITYDSPTLKALNESTD